MCQPTQAWAQLLLLLLLCRRVTLRCCLQVLQLPVLRPRNAKKLLGDGMRTVPILGTGAVPTTDDTLEQFLQHAGMLFGKDPSKWENIGQPTTDITKQDGKRIIKRTGLYTGTELHLIRYAVLSALRSAQ